MASNGVYGTRVAPRINPKEDIEIFYSFSPTRASNDMERVEFTRLSYDLLSDVNVKEGNNNIIQIDGLMNLKLPIKYFNKKGFYTVYIRPKEIECIITNVSSLTSFPDVKGIVLTREDKNNGDINSFLNTNNSLVGYRVIYLDSNGKKQDYYRLITSNNKCEPVEQQVSSVNENSIRYRFNENGLFSFLTLTPSVAPSFKPNASPFIGQTGQKIIIVNTKFEPIMLDIEMVDKDIDTVSTMLEGSQLRSLDHGLVTTFNDKNEIYHQSEHYSLKDKYTGEPIYEVKKQHKESIDFTQTINDK